MYWYYKEKKVKYKQKIFKEWKLYFAFLPTPIGEEYPLKQGQKIVWLKFIERKFLHYCKGKRLYEYREI